MNGNSSSKKTTSLVVSHLTLRWIVGLLGMAFPFILVLGAQIYSGAWMEIESSISKYYYTSAKHLFGGILFVVGFFLIAYKGYEDFSDSVSNCGFLLCKLKLKDNIAGNIAGLLAIGVVLFPTTKECETTDVVGILHYISAFGFFSLLIYFCLCLFTRSKSKDMTNRKKFRNRVYKFCGYTMLVCILLIPAISIFGDSKPCDDKGTYAFWLETVALLAFGISWFVKGDTILKDQQ